MVHIKITCDDCGHSLESDCQGVLAFIIDPKEQFQGGVMTAYHHVTLPMVLPEIMRYILEECLEHVQEEKNNAVAEMLLGQIKDIEEKLKDIK